MRSKRINNIRALAIILVVIGHSIIMYSDEWSLHVYDNNIISFIKRGINIIQMPLFFSLSGYLFSNNINKYTDRLTFIKKKIKRLLLPYVLIGLFWMIPIKYILNIKGYREKGLYNIIVKGLFMGNDNGHLWYLLTLFFIFIISIIIKPLLFDNNQYAWIIVLGAMLAIHLLADRMQVNIILKTVFKNYIWFYMGILLNNEMIKKLEKKIKKYLLPVTLIYIFLLVWYNNKIINLIIAGLLLIVIYAYIPEGNNKIIDVISKNSFGIYLFHSPLIYILLKVRTNYELINIAINFFVFGGISLVMTKYIRKTKLKIIIGE